MNNEDIRAFTKLIRESVRDGVLDAHKQLDSVPLGHPDQDKWDEFLKGLFFKSKHRPQ